MLGKDPFGFAVLVLVDEFFGGVPNFGHSRMASGLAGTLALQHVHFRSKMEGERPREPHRVTPLCRLPLAAIRDIANSFMLFASMRFPLRMK